MLSSLSTPRFSWTSIVRDGTSSSTRQPWGLAGAGVVHSALQSSLTQPGDEGLGTSAFRVGQPELATALGPILQGNRQVHGGPGRALPALDAGVSGNAPNHLVEAQCGGYQGQRGLQLRFRMTPTLRVYFATGELKDVLKQVEEIKQDMCRKPVNVVQFKRHKPQGAGLGAPPRGSSGVYAARTTPEVSEPQVPDPGDLRWEAEDDSGYGYQYDEENDETYYGLVDQEEVFRAETLGPWTNRNGHPQGDLDSRDSGHSGAPRPSATCPVCSKLGHTRERCWQLIKCDRRGSKHPTSPCRRYTIRLAG
ncbi:hypothetical protein PHMEG_00010755 [Phytophthora megakarya]|uniref:Eukaryotic/viral aspartic protease n=1 Tax=Phytophthora megakarya TaxID=4795 RepID=A0A225WCW5_9STRA|nr:hypothetical protein PHMEG_00010755 [Phytophthora megakarya]